ncbi:hypothetical protein Gotur_010584 [Gossypium turneri]
MEDVAKPGKVSFKEMLMKDSNVSNGEDVSLDDIEISLLKGDVYVSMEGIYLETVKFACLEDYEWVLPRRPWMIYGHYLVVQPWSRDFTIKETLSSKIVAWIRFLGLLYQCYTK